MALVVRELGMMSTTILCAVLVLILGYSKVCPLVECRRLGQDEASSQDKHEQWMSVHGRSYIDDVEKEKRSNIFADNAAYVEKFNSQQNRSFTLKTNSYADLTDNEFMNAHTGGKYRRSNRSSSSQFDSSFISDSITNVPSSIDWRQKGAVSPVREQLQCGSCWAFASAEAVESLTKIRTGKAYILSVQQLLDCATQNPNSRGCGGGNPEDAFDYLISNGGITTESNYPYKAKDGSCDRKRASQIAARISDYKYVPENNENALLKAVAKQPVTAFVNSEGKEFRLYSSGVFTGSCGTTLDHVVLIVGYGQVEDGTKYWVIKNSWGEQWGEKGYMRIQRNYGPAQGKCGIAMSASYPIA
ncbi:hypothetical protein G4B88_015227 [Cannabis sativa]|uniref:Uncharacterized protein n=1 Tax=Cannabis sativa TaxID=3483 RepID=A0A7J6HBF1_CANSA|nr:hypothetical protein G4B88_015227 [Cannabis sativa]